VAGGKPAPTRRASAITKPEGDGRPCGRPPWVGRFRQGFFQVGLAAGRERNAADLTAGGGGTSRRPAVRGYRRRRPRIEVCQGRSSAAAGFGRTPAQLLRPADAGGPGGSSGTPRLAV
jgi:hypothetical protein